MKTMLDRLVRHLATCTKLFELDARRLLAPLDGPDLPPGFPNPACAAVARYGGRRPVACNPGGAGGREWGPQSPCVGIGGPRPGLERNRRRSD